MDRHHRGGAEIEVIGGTTVSVTTNTASVYVGGSATDMTADDATVPAINAAGTAFLAGQEPTGNVTVTDTATAETRRGPRSTCSAARTSPSPLPASM